MAEENEEESLEFTSTWLLATVCLMLVIISVLLASGIHRLGKYLERKKSKPLHVSLEKMKQELMLIGFISLFITAFQGPITHICIPRHSTKILLPCKKNVEEDFSIERLAPKVGHCERKGMEPFLSIEGMHQLDIFVFVLAITHIILSISTMFLGSIKIHFWKHWEDEFKNPPKTPQKFEKKKYIHVIHHSFIKMHSPYTMSPIRGWLVCMLLYIHYYNDLQRLHHDDQLRYFAQVTLNMNGQGELQRHRPCKKIAFLSR
ncbi:MLO-like protein 13 [Cryptomeria japonica]|uniref:MLO-like protein 13 n=1 Tax=Cryptomeria japonica TaxID=3369 RepID=UPI0027D9FFC3|nr:MLO-like protein 13 [Cryptomeria japonica]